MCKQCKSTSREFNIELTTIHGNRHNRTGCDLHDHVPVFTYGGEPMPYDRHAVGKDWMLQALPSDSANKYLYHLSSSDDVELFGAVYDNIAYLYVVRLWDSIPNPEPEPEYRILQVGEPVQEGAEFHGYDGWRKAFVSRQLGLNVGSVGTFRRKLQPTAQ